MTFRERCVRNTELRKGRNCEAVTQSDANSNAQSSLPHFYPTRFQKTNVPGLFPEKIKCEDRCDPESLGNDNKMYCLKKISKGLQQYQNLLGEYFQEQKINDLQSALKKLSSLLQKDPDVTERTHSSKNNTISWEHKPIQKHTLWRLQSFSVVVARVFAHSAALNVKIQQ